MFQARTQNCRTQELPSSQESVDYPPEFFNGSRPQMHDEKNETR